MKINFDFYKEKQNNLTPIEKKIVQIIKDSQKRDYSRIIEENKKLEFMLALSDIRKNILNWYPFMKDATILEIEPNFGEITEVLCEKAQKVVAVESSLEKAQAIEKRFFDNENLEVIVADIENVALEEKFDYVILYKPKQIKIAKNFLKPQGIILLATNNRFGISYFAGASYNGKIYNTFLENENDLYGKKEIEELLKKENMNQYRFFYPLPNYKCPNVIFSDQYMPNENTTKLMYNIMYNAGSVVVFDELKALKQVTKNGLFDFFANSFLIEIKIGQVEVKDAPKFISFNNNRKEKYRLMTIIDKNEVSKKIISEQAIEHIENIELNIKKLKKLGFNVIDYIDNNKVISEHVDQDTFDKLIIKQILSGNSQEAYNLIDKWYGYIRERLLKIKKSELNPKIKENIEEQIPENMHILKNGYIDLVFENTFYKDNEFLFFDQEWYEDGIPLEFLLYRAINNMYSYNLEIESFLPKIEMFKKYNLEEYLPLFEKIEQFLQKEIIDDTMNSINKQSLNLLHDINYTGILLNQIKDFEENDVKQNEYIRVLEKSINEQNKYIKQIEEDNAKKQEYIEALEKIKDEQQNKSKRKFF